MKLIKKHKFTTFIIGVYVVMIILAYFIGNLFFSNTGKPVYGDRLEGQEEVLISDSQYTNLKTGLTDNKSVKEVTTHLSGKTLNVIITVAYNTALKDAKVIGSEVLDYLDKDQLAFYDVQVFIKEDVLVLPEDAVVEDLAELLEVSFATLESKAKELKIEVEQGIVISFDNAKKIAKAFGKNLKSQEDASFPIIGYKKNTASSLTWTKDR